MLQQLWTADLLGGNFSQEHLQRSCFERKGTKELHFVEAVPSNPRKYQMLSILITSICRE